MSSLLRNIGSLLLVGLLACSSAQDQDSDESANSTGGPGEIHPGWFKTPEAISETMIKTWELTLTQEEELQNFGGLRAALGGVNVSQQGATVAKPHELYALASHSLSVFAAEKLVARQIKMTAEGKPYLFDGLGFAGDETDGCFANDAEEWCDAKDGITVATPIGDQLTKEQRKRLMHTMQSIGEFFLMAIDNQTIMPGSTQHAPAFLVDEVFLPKLRETKSAQLAWQETVATILMSGYFFDLPADQ